MGIAKNSLQHETEPFFSVITATYQGGSTIAGVYDSLCKQTYTNFEWIVIDDGSTDNTAALVSDWVRNSKFPVKLHRQLNGGKFRAIDVGVSLAKGQFVVIFDDDDKCVPEALGCFRDFWSETDVDEREFLAGVLVTCKSPDGVVVGDLFPKEARRSTIQELSYLHRCKGERWAAVRTDLHRRYPFQSVPDNIKFLPEGLIWHRLGREHRFVCRNKPLRIFKILGDGLSSRVRRADPEMLPGLILNHSMILDEDLSWFSRAPDVLIKSAINLTRYRVHALTNGITLLPGVRLQNWWAQALMWWMVPFGIASYIVDCLRRLSWWRVM